MRQRSKVTAIVLLLTIATAVLAFNDAVGAFLPIVSIQISEIQTTARLGSGSFSYVPGFYSFGAMVSAVSGITPHDIVYWPIQLLPFIFVMFALARDLSGNSRLAATATFIIVISNTQGSRVLLYQHGLGSILMLLTYLLLIRLWTQREGRYALLILLSTVPLIYISYNVTLRTVVAIFSFGVLSIVALFLHLRNHNGTSRWYIAALGIPAVLVTLWSPWFYETFLPQALASTSGLSAIDIFLTGYFGSSETAPAVLTTAALDRPIILTYLGILKYVILAVGGISLVSIAIIRYNNYSSLLVYYLIIGSACIVALVYFLLRLAIGQFSFAVLFLPGLFATLLLARETKSRPLQLLPQVLLVLLLMVSVGVLGVAQSAGTVERDPGHYRYVEPSVDWYETYGTGRILTDVRTRYLYLEYLSDISQRGELDNQERANQVRTYPIDGFVSRVLGYESSSAASAEYIVVNYRLNVVSLQQWANLGSWSQHRTQIETNSRYNKVYSNKDISVLTPSTSKM